MRIPISLQPGIAWLALLVAWVPQTSAHMVWISSTPDAAGANVRVHFGENVSDCTYKLPEFLRGITAELDEDGKRSPLAFQELQTEEFLGMAATAPVAGAHAVALHCVYGVYHGTRLEYYAKHYQGTEAAGFPQSSLEQRLNVSPEVMSAAGSNVDGLRIVVTFDGQPVPSAKVNCRNGQGEQSDASTNADGVAEFPKLSPGPISIWVQHLEPNATGRLGEESYKSVTHIATLTLARGNEQPVQPPTGEVSDVSELRAAAAIANGRCEFRRCSLRRLSVCLWWPYGKAHDHSREQRGFMFLGGASRAGHLNTFEQATLR